jgi:Glycosyl transferases group 1
MKRPSLPNSAFGKNRLVYHAYKTCGPLHIIVISFGFFIIMMLAALLRLLNLDVNCSLRSCASSNNNCGESKGNSTFIPNQYIPQSTLSTWKFDYYGPDQAIQDYNPDNHPIFTGTQTINVRLFTEVFGGQTSPMNECKHILYDGLSKSDVIKLQGVTYTLANKCKKDNWNESWKDDDLWVLDSHHILESCDIIFDWMQQTLTARNNKKWKILAVDYGDAHDKVYECEKLAKAAEGWYFVAKRSIEVGREWDEGLQFPRRGSLTKSTSKSIMHSPYPARTDVAREIANVVTKKGLSSPVDVNLLRDLDVSHFYARQTNVGTKAYFDNLRNGINSILRFMDGMVLGNNRKLTTFCGLAGKDKKLGRNVVSPEYINTMLRSKIIVVAQRDAWSDHYRLMEALSSGAMILADETLILPRGLRHGESLIMFHSYSDLREKLLYYLQHDEERLLVAKKGWDIAMGYHRSWHAMESLIFGHPITNAGDSKASFQKDIISNGHV